MAHTALADSDAEPTNPLHSDLHQQSTRLPWLFSAPVDLAAFAGSALLSFALLVLGAAMGWLDRSVPQWTWVTTILMIDVAHVYATGFRVYFDRQELKRRPGLYLLTPVFAFVIGWALYSESPQWFWRCLAYMAVFHFVRQQYGWVALYRAKANDRQRVGKWIDLSAIYLATLYPLVYWHCHQPEQFAWFVEGDFVFLSLPLDRWLAPVYWFAMIAYVCRASYQGLIGGLWNPGKDLVVATTALCWYLGIITFDSDYAFTVTNVIIHGVPYMVLIYWYQVLGKSNETPQNSAAGSEEGSEQSGPGPTRQDDQDNAPASTSASPRSSGTAWQILIRFVAVVWVLAYFEELLWDRSLWHERAWLFGSAWQSNAAMQAVLVALLAVPQVTHYVLDGFIWKRRSSRQLRQLTRHSEEPSPRSTGRPAS